MSDITLAREALKSRILDGDGEASRAERAAAYANAGPPGPLSRLIKKVATDADKIGDDDVAAVRAGGLSEDRIFELVVCAAIGQAARQYDAAVAALEAAAGSG